MYNTILFNLSTLKLFLLSLLSALLSAQPKEKWKMMFKTIVSYNPFPLLKRPPLECSSLIKWVTWHWCHFADYCGTIFNISDSSSIFINRDRFQIRKISLQIMLFCTMWLLSAVITILQLLAQICLLSNYVTGNIQNFFPWKEEQIPNACFSSPETNRVSGSEDESGNFKMRQRLMGASWVLTQFLP